MAQGPVLGSDLQDSEHVARESSSTSREDDVVKLSMHPETFSEEEPKLIPFVVYEYGKLSVSESFCFLECNPNHGC